MVYGEENSLQFRTHGITRASHQISQSTYSLLFFKRRAGYESKSLVEWTRKNKTELQKVLVFPRGFAHGAWNRWSMREFAGAATIATPQRPWYVDVPMGNHDVNAYTWDFAALHM